MQTEVGLTTTETKYGRLVKLARDINQSAEDAEKTAATARKWCSAAVTEAIVCGAYLCQAKEIVGHGNWLTWLAEHCKGLTERTAQRYMAEAKTTNVSDLDGPSIRQLVTAGVILLPDHEPQPKLPLHSSVLRRFDSLNTKLQREPIQTWPTEAQTQLRESLRPIVSALGGTL